MEFQLPDVGEGTTEGEIVRWLVEVGQRVELDQPLVEVETDKAVVELPAPAAGTIVSLHGDPGETVAVGSTLVVIAADGEATAEELPKANRSPSAAPMAAPYTRRLAAESGIDLGQVRGTGPNGRIVPDDIRRELDARIAVRAQRAEEQANAPTDRGLSPARRRVAEQMSRAWREIPHVTVVEKYELSELVQLKHQLKPDADGAGVRVTYVAFLIKVLALTLPEYPEFNARWQGDRLVRYPDIHIGFATDTEAGLAAPVIRRAGEKSVLEVAREVARLADGIRQGSLRPEEIGGSTITVTTGGRLGGLFATPIIHAPEVAIVGMYRIQAEPVIRNGAVQAGQVGYLSLTFDHRVADGVQAARFLNALGESLSRPGRLLLRLR